FSASAKVVGETSGPTAGPAPKAGGGPGGTSAGFCSAGFWPWLRSTEAAPKIPKDVTFTNCLRDFAMNPPRGIVAACMRRFVARIGTACSCDLETHAVRRTDAV